MVCPKCFARVDPSRFRRILERIAILWLTYRTRVTKRRSVRFSTPEVLPARYEPSFPSLKSQIERLAALAWQSQDSLKCDLVLGPHQLPVGAYEKVIEAMLNHVRRVAPGFTVPYKTPRVIIDNLVDAAGKFQVSDGWVTVRLAKRYLLAPKTARAILAHEASHYILECSGIRESSRDLNERLTDVCMFVCGLGDLFLDGYESTSCDYEYREGHRLGYLTDPEYQFVGRYVVELRSNKTLKLPSRDDELSQSLTTRIGDLEARDRLIKHAKTRYPEKTDSQVYELVIEQLERDRR